MGKCEKTREVLCFSSVHVLTIPLKLSFQLLAVFILGPGSVLTIFSRKPA